MKTFNLAEIYTWNILPSWILYWMTFKLAKCSIRVTALSEYLDCALDKRSWVSLHNSLTFTQILLLLLGVSMMITSITDQFSAHYLERLQYNWVDFYSQLRSHNFDTGWVLCHISMVFSWIPFKSQKGTPTMFTPSTCQVSTHFSKRFTL